VTPGQAAQAAYAAALAGGATHAEAWQAAAAAAIEFSRRHKEVLSERER